MKLLDWLNCKLNKLKYRIRNFEKYYIKKNILIKIKKKLFN